MRHPLLSDMLAIAAFLLGGLAVVAFAFRLELAAFLLLLAGVALTPIIGMIAGGHSGSSHA
ncbi:conserved protein of unknown function [Rhodovastum atsumiense]|uniref:Uncharacterized protein n=1 Tax=Rhodovastum atsumiense TaxID=504468 RepID=A0A5M6IS92_9PROT|nr:hypothetical protein [Rhodovastum atsumiense]KAA5611174.1 hypothetical protein F1189_15505 [Rhodovastum atsumiense]CAH2602519.1 conserved protein of unknown function [Rhodovastum atsumiense]